MTMQRLFLALIAVFVLGACNQPEVIDEQWLEDNYAKREVMIEMRDGIRLHTVLYEPVDAESRPVLMVRTPYSCAPYGEGWSHDLTGYMSEFLRNDYIIAFQDVRGRFMSEGEFVNVRPFAPNKSGYEIDEASDTYDSIEWIVNNTDNNGAVGVTGMSYPGFYATMAALSGHPALKAVSPQAPILDWYKGDDVHHNGALMLLDIYSFAPYMFKEHNNPVEEDHGLPSPVGDDAYGWFLKQRTPSSLTAALPDTLDFWNEILSHPDYDDYWKERSLEPYLTDIHPAILVVGGEYDTDDCYGALNTYKLIRQNSPETDLHFVYGPWTHGGWHEKDYEGLGGLKFGENLSTHFMKEIEFPFFRYYLEGKGRRPEPVYIYASGSDRWQTMQHWPSEDAESRALYLSDGRSLSFESPSQDESSSTYHSDPSSPVPFMADATKRNNAYMVADQSFASERNDVLTFISDTQNDILKLQGELKVKLDVSLTTDDADIIVKFIDVYPDGYQMLVRGDVFPVRYRNGFENPQPAVPGEMMHIEFTMNDIAHWILPGHKMMVQIQSSWFPLVNMNPQTYMDNIYSAAPEDYAEADITIYHQKNAASALILPVVE